MMLLTLPMAAPALIPAGSEVRWADAPVLQHRVHAGETLQRLARRGLADPADIAMLADANGLSVDARLQPGQAITIPGALLKRKMLSAEVAAFAGEARLLGGAPLSVGMTMHEGDIIETGANSFVSLDAAGKRLTLPSSSRVKISALHRVVLSGEVVRSFSLMPLRDDWLAQVGLRRQSDGGPDRVDLALANAADRHD